MIGRACPATLRIVLVLLCVLLSGCVPARTPHPPTVTLKVAVTPQLTNVPFYIAQEEGFYAEQGLQVEFVRVASSRDAIPSLVQGDLDVLAGFPNIGVLNAIARDTPLSFVAGRGYHAAAGCPFNGMIARKALIDSGEVASVADMRGRRVAMDRGTAGEYQVHLLLAKGGLTVQDVTPVEIPDTAVAQALEDGSIDFAFTSEPTLTSTIEAGHGVLWMQTREFAPDEPNGVITFGPNLLEKNPQVGERFMVAFLKAVRQYNQGKTERNLEILSKHIELDREFLLKSCWPPMRSDGVLDVQRVLGF